MEYSDWKEIFQSIHRCISKNIKTLLIGQKSEKPLLEVDSLFSAIYVLYSDEYFQIR